MPAVRGAGWAQGVRTDGRRGLVGEDTPGPTLGRRVPGATRDGPAPSVHRRLPDSLMARMQAAVEAARAADGGDAEGSAGSEAGAPDSPGSPGSPDSGGSEGLAGSGASGAGGLTGSETADGASFAAGASFEVSGWAGSEQEPITEPLPDMQAVLAALDLARQYDSAADRPALGPGPRPEFERGMAETAAGGLAGPAVDGPGGPGTGRNPVGGPIGVADPDQKAELDRVRSGSGGSASVGSGSGAPGGDQAGSPRGVVGARDAAQPIQARSPRSDWSAGQGESNGQHWQRRHRWLRCGQGAGFAEPGGQCGQCGQCGAGGQPGAGRSLGTSAREARAFSLE